MSYSSIEIRDGLVYKRAEPEVLEMEALRMQLAAGVAGSSGMFLVPKLVRLDLPGSTMATEFIPQLKNLRELAFEREVGTEAIFAQAGRALATVHQELRLPEGKIRTLPDYLRSAADDDVPLHGDFCWANVCWLAPEQKIVLLDWATAPLLGSMANYGSRYFDLLWFSWSLFFWTPPRRFFEWRPERLMRALIRGYAERERGFEWAGYVRLRSSMRPLLSHYWRRKQQLMPAPPLLTCAHWLGWLRWLVFPLRQADNLPSAKLSEP